MQIIQKAVQILSSKNKGREWINLQEKKNQGTIPIRPINYCRAFKPT